MKSNIIFFALSIVFNTIYSQSCLPDGITFETQTEIDNFQTNHPNCTEIEGDVQIGWDYLPEISNLDGLNVLKSFGGDLFIYYNPDLASLTGLNNVTSIGGNLIILNNDSLTNLFGLNNVTSIEGDLRIRYNDAMVSLSGLENLTSIDETLLIQGNPELMTLSGLDNLTSIGITLDIDDNEVLNNTTALENLIHIGGGLNITNNNAITTLTGLENVNSIGGQADEGLYIVDNPLLVSIAGIENIIADSIFYLYILYNNSLSNCEIQSICDYLNEPNGEIEIHDNAIGCNSPEEVLDSCEANAVNIDENIILDKIVLYPNPASQQLSILAEGTRIDVVAIYTPTGQQVFMIRPKSETIDISNLQPGLYIVEVMVEGRKVRQKLVIQ